MSDVIKPQRNDYGSTSDYNAAIEGWKDRMGRPNPADFQGGASSNTYQRFLSEFNKYMDAYPGIGARDPRESPYNAVNEWASGVYMDGEETFSYQPYEPPPPPPLSQEEWLAANPAPTYADMLDADPTVLKLWGDLRDGKTISANEMAAAENAVQQQFNTTYNNWLSTYDSEYLNGAPLPKRDYAAGRGYRGNVPKPESSDFDNGSAYNQAMNQWGSTVRNVPPPIPSDFSGPGGGGAMEHAMQEWELQQQQVDELVSFKRALFGERAINDSLQRHNWDYDTYVIDPNLYMDRLLESRDAYKEYDQEKLGNLGFYAFDMRFTTLADGTVVDNGQLTTQQWQDFSSSGGRTFSGASGSYGYEEYDAIHKYNNMISRGVDADTAEEWFEGYSDDMDGRGAHLNTADKLMAEEFERKREGYIGYMDELIESGDIGAYLEAYDDSPHHLKMTLLESRRDRGFIEEDDFKSQFVGLLNANSDNSYFYYDVWNEQFVAGPSLSTEEKERRGEDGKLIFNRGPRIELFTATPYALAQMGIGGSPEDYFDQSILDDVTDFLFGGSFGDPRDMWKVVSENIYDSFKDQDNPEDTMKQYDLLYGQKAIGQEQSYWDSTQDKVNSALNGMSTVVSLMGPIAAAVMVTLRAANGQTIKTSDYVTVAIAGLQMAGKITPPPSAADAQKAADAAETASKAAGASDKVAAAAGAAEKAKLLAGVGLGAMTYRETILLVNAIGSGDPKEFLMTTYGGNYIQSGFAKLGITTDNFSPAVIQGLNKVTNKMLVGDSFEEALASAGTDAVKDWLEANGVEDNIEAVLKEYGASMSETTRDALSAFDAGVLQPIIGGIETAVGVDFSDIRDNFSKFDADVLQPIFDDFEAIADKIDTKVLTPITDAATSMLDGFINTSKAQGIPLDSMDAVRERLKVATGDAFKNLPEAARDAIEEGLKDAVVNGEINEAAMTQALASATITTKIVEENIGEYANDVVGARLMTQAINSAVVSAALGGDASDAFLMTIGIAAANSVKNSIQDGTLSDDLAVMSDKVTGEFTNTRLATEEMARQQDFYDTNYADAAAIQTQMKDEWQAVADLQTYAETTGRQSDIDAYNNALTTYIDKAATEYQPLLEAYDNNMANAQNAHNDAVEDFNNASDDLNEATVTLNDSLTPAFLEIEKGTVSELAPSFDESWYRNKYNIPEGESAYNHYLQNGLRDGDAANAEEFGTQYDAAFNKLMNTAIQASGLNPAKLSPEELQRIRNQLTSRYGDDIQSLKDGLANESALKWRVQSSLMALSDLGNAQDYVLTEENIDSMKERLEAVGLPFEDLTVGDSVPVSERRALAVAESNQKSSMGIELGGAADWADVVSGDAQLTFNPVSGKLTWEVLSTEGMQSISYDDEYGIVLQGIDKFGNDVLTVQDTNNQYAIVDGEMKPLNGTFAGPDGEAVEYVNGDIKLRENQTITEQTDDGGFRFYEANANGTTYVQEQDADGNLTEAVPAMQTEEFQAVFGSSDPLETLLFTDPEAWLKTIGDMPQDVGEDVAGNWWYKTAKGMMETLDKYKEEGFTLSYSGSVSGIISGNPEVGDKTAQQFVDDYVNVIEATNEFMGGIDWFIETVKNVPIGMSPAPHYAAVGMEYNENIHKAMIEDFQSGQEEIPGSTFQQVTNAISGMANATHTEEYRQERDKMYALLESDGVWEAISTYPGMFVKDLVMKEVIQEVPTLLFGGGFKIAGQLVGRGLKQSDDIVASISNTFGFTGAVAIDMAEAYGGEASGAYDEFYTLATTPKFNAVTGEMEAPMTVEEAERFASENAHAVGISSMMITGLTMGIGGADMYKKVFGKDMSTATLKEKNTFLQMYETLKPMSSEFVTGGIEEGSVAAVKELLIYNSGLDPDRDWSQNILTSATLGAILEGTVAGTIGGLNIIDPSAPGSSDPGSVEGRILMNGNPTFQLELADTIGNGGSAADVEAVLDNFGLEDSVIRTDILDLSFDSEYNSSQEVSVMFEDLGFVASEADIANFVGTVDADTTLSSDIATFIDPLFTDRGEVQEAALAEGIILTDEEADLYVQQDTEENVAAVLKLDIQDPDTDVGTAAVTVEQIKNEFLSNGRIITDAQAEQFLGDTLESAQTDISEFLEEKPGYGMPTVGTGMVRATGIDDHGVYLTNAQTQEFLNKYGPEDISAAIGEWVASEPEGIRYTMTDQQVRDHAAGLGYELSDEEVAMFTRKTVGAAEVQMNQKFQNDPEFGTLMPAAQNDLNALRDDLNGRIDAIMESNPNASRIEAIEGAVNSLVEADNDFVTHAILATALTRLGGDIATDIKEANDNIIDVESRLAKEFADAMEVEGTTRDEAIATAVAQVSSDLDVTKADLLKTINTDDAALDSKMTELNDARVAEIATLRTNVWNAIGELRTTRDGQAATDEELQKAIDEVAADLGTTSADIYSKLNTNAAGLNALDKEVSDLETDLNGKIDANLAADMGRDAAVNKAIADIVTENENFTTHAEVAEYLSDYRTGEEITAEIKTVADSVTALETELVELINANADESLTEDQKLDQAIQDLAGSTNTSVADIYSKLGTAETARGALGDRITKVKADLKAEIATLRENVWGSIETLKNRVGSNDLTDAQLQEAIDEVAADLGTTSADIYSKLNTNAAGLNALDKEVSDLETDLNGKIDANLAADMGRDAAVNKAIADIVTENENFTTHAEVAEYLSDYRTGEEITAEIKTVADSVTALETELVELINANADESLTEDQKLDQAIQDLAGSTNTSVADIYAQLGSAADARDALDTRIQNSLDYLNRRITKERNQLQRQIDANIAAGQDADTALQNAIDTVVGQLGDTEADLLARIGTDKAELSRDIAAVQSDVAAVQGQIVDLMAQGSTFEEALNAVIAQQDTNKTELLTRLGTTEQALSANISALQTDVTDIKNSIATLVANGATFEDALAQVSTQQQLDKDALLTKLSTSEENLAGEIDTLSQSISAVQSDLTDVKGQITTLMEQGASFEEALAQVSAQQQIDKDALLARIGTSEGELSSQIGDVQAQVTDLGTTLNARIDELAAESGDRDAATTQAINELATQQGTDTAELLSLLEEQKNSTAAVAEILGKPEREVTQEDIDNVTDLIASQDVIENPDGYVPTPEDMLYDVNNDGVINEIDQVLLEDSFGGQDVQFAQESQFGDASGLYLQIAEQNEALAEQEAQRQADLAAQQQQQQEQQQQITQQRAREQGEQLDQLGEQAVGAVQQQVSVGAAPKGPLTQIDYLFDVYGDNIFATPRQKELFLSPYGGGQPPQRAAQGGIIQTNDELLRLLGE